MFASVFLHEPQEYLSVDNPNNKNPNKSQQDPTVYVKGDNAWPCLPQEKDEE